MATTYDKASLVMIPSGVKESKLYSIKPTDGSGDFTFSRGTDTATRVNASGLIEKERSNQILQSNTFTTTWSTTRASFVSGQAGYDGTNDAWAFVDDANNSTHLSAQSLSLGASVATFSIYAKAGDVDFLAVRFEGSAVDYAYFNLASGTLGTIDSDYIEARITDVGGGWYRCEATRVLAASGNQVVLLAAQANNDPTYAGAGTTAIYIQDAQLEQGLVATDYIETTTAAVYEGITDNLPRLDYSGGASCPSLLLEPSRTNGIVNSEYISAGVNWSAASGMTTENNSIVSPEGVQNATKLIRPNSTAPAWIRESNITATIGLNQVISVFAKSGSNDILNITYYDQTAGDLFFNYDLSDGTIYSAPTGSAYYVDAGIEDYGNGWYRCYAIAEAGRVDPQFQLSVGTNRGGAANSYLYIYGASHEKDVSYQTSYIPTYGASASRAQDLSVTASPSTSYFGQTEGTIFTEIKINAITSGLYSRVFNLKNSGGSNQIYIQQNDSRLTGVVFNGSNQFSGSLSSGSLVVGQTYKAALAYKDSDYAFYVDGTQIDTGSSSGLGTLAVDRLDFTTGVGNIGLGNEVKQALVFKTRLTNAELAALTA